MWTAILTCLVLAAPGDAHREAMKKLHFLAGEWRGEGSMRMGPGEPSKSTVVEKVELRQDGLTLVLEGIGKEKTPEGEKIVHHAVGLLCWDAQKSVYAMRAVRHDGNFVDAEGRFEGDTFVWGFEAPGMGRVRYKIRLDAEGRWHETGDFSRDGTTWTPFFEMTLTKDKEKKGAG